MRLSGPQFKQFQDALVRAFPGVSDMAILTMTGLGVNLAHVISTSGSMSSIAFNLVQWAESQGRARDLWVAALRDRPHNPELLAITFFGPTPATSGGGSVLSHASEPPPAPVVADYSGRPLHPEHREGVVRLVFSVLLCDPDQARDLLGRLFAPSFTYGEVQALSERAVVRAIDRTFGDDHVLPEARIDELLRALPLVRPERRVCPVCQSLDVARVAGRWQRDDADVCPRAPSHPEATGATAIYRAVRFERPFRAWTDRAECEPGTTHDANRLPITEGAIGQHFEAQRLHHHQWFGGHGGVAWCEYLLHHSGHFPPPHTMAAKLSVLRSLADPSGVFLDETAFRVEWAKFLAWTDHQTDRQNNAGVSRG